MESSYITLLIILALGGNLTRRGDCPKCRRGNRDQDPPDSVYRDRRE